MSTKPGGELGLVLLVEAQLVLPSPTLGRKTWSLAGHRAHRGALEGTAEITP